MKNIPVAREKNGETTVYIIPGSLITAGIVVLVYLLICLAFYMAGLG